MLFVFVFVVRAFVLLKVFVLVVLVVLAVLVVLDVCLMCLWWFFACDACLCVVLA